MAIDFSNLAGNIADKEGNTPDNFRDKTLGEKVNNINNQSFTPNTEADPTSEFKRLQSQKNQLQNIPAEDGVRNEYQMGIQNLLDMGDKYKDAYLKEYPIGGNINLNMKPFFAHAADAYKERKDQITNYASDIIEKFATSGPDESSNSEESDVLLKNKGGIIHAADGVFAESETMEMPLTLPEIKRHRKKLEAGFQYDIEVDGRNQSFSFNEQLSPSGIETLREREQITAEPNLNYRANGGYMSSFPNQNLNTESLSASDNIDDRIMKNLQFEKMSPGMMGYNTGGIVEPMAPDFNSGF